MPQLILLDAARKIFRLHGFNRSMLEEAIPYVKEFQEKLMVLKIGGSIIEEDAAQKEFIEDVAFMNEIGIKLILVHGGGKHLSAELKKRGVHSEFKNGLRVTSQEVIDAARDVFASINQSLGKALRKENLSPFCFEPHDVPLLTGRVIAPEYGLAGEPVSLQKELLLSKIDEGCIPVLPSLGANGDTPDDRGSALNINGDTVAGFIAQKVAAEKLILMTDVDGICNAEGELIETLTPKKVEALIDEGIIRGGMIPKVRTCLNALTGGVHKAHIINGSGRTVVNEVLTNKGVGTQILQE